MTRRITQRLERLQMRHGQGCATCRGWVPAVYEDNNGVGDRPGQCPDGNWSVPIQLVRQIIGISWDDM